MAETLVRGKLVHRSAHTLVLKPDSGDEVSVSVKKDATIYLDGAQATLDNLRTEDVVCCDNNPASVLEVTRETPPVEPVVGTEGAPEKVSPVADLNAHDAVDKVNRMTSKDRLQLVVDHDTRTSVKEAATKRLSEL